MTITLPFETKTHKQIIIFMGIQASGKSTFYKSVLAPLGYGHINLDSLHTRNKERIAISRFYEQEKSFVIDNTNPEITDRQRYIPDARTNGYEIIGIFFQSIAKDCIVRNRMREKSVPEKAIPCTQNKLQLPSLDEGFDGLFFVKIADNGFEISKWKE
ncbi:MAG: AAA family ATPase [Bacteroidaceae bacterium]|nr:AAA family ATPase [Bacteroidaceae bacterium]